MMKSSNKGFTLIEIIIAMGIFGLIAIATAQVVINLQDSLRKAQQSTNRVLSLYRLTDNITKKDAFTKSLALAPTNNALRACVSGGALGACASNCCTANTSNELIILDDTDTNPNLALRRKLMGTVADPAFYTQEGELCDPAAKTCYYKVTGSFSATCPAGAATCDKSDLLQLSLKIQAAAANINVKERNLLLEYTPDNNAKPTMLTIATQNITVGQKVKIPVYANSGHPQEKQDFIFELCNPPTTNAIATATCYGFINDIGYVVIEGKAAGTATGQLQINDTGTSNNLSDIQSFQINVTN